jgi:hypothetical protein
MGPLLEHLPGIAELRRDPGPAAAVLVRHIHDGPPEKGAVWLRISIPPPLLSAHFWGVYPPELRNQNGDCRFQDEIVRVPLLSEQSRPQSLLTDQWHNAVRQARPV